MPHAKTFVKETLPQVRVKNAKAIAPQMKALLKAKEQAEEWTRVYGAY